MQSHTVNPVSRQKKKNLTRTRTASAATVLLLSRKKKKWSGEGGGDLSDKTMKRNDDYSKIGNLKVMECHRRPVRPFKTYKD